MSKNNFWAKWEEENKKPTPYNERTYGVAAVGPGWTALVNTLYDRVEDVRATGVDIEVRQVKEKFGRLRFYYRFNSCVEQSLRDGLVSAVLAAEGQSAIICEVCGKARNKANAQRLCSTNTV